MKRPRRSGGTATPRRATPHVASRLRRSALGATLALGASALLPLRAAAQEPATLPASDWEAIKRAIGDQLEAMRAGDAVRAYGHASAGIRSQFGDAEVFMRMVQGGYAALLRARYTEFLDGAVIEGSPVQPLRLVMPDNTVQVALYQMQRDGTQWRIAGCVIAPSTVRAA
jgi:hypothetical protein